MLLPPLPAGDDREPVVAWVREHLGDLALEGADGVRAAPARGGQDAADEALAVLDLTGYASRRSTVLPEADRGASRLSPYIRHGLLPLPRVWAAAGAAPSRDRAKFRDELLWQEYARHLYAREGRATLAPLRFEPPAPPAGAAGWQGDPWPERMACTQEVVRELHEDGWIVNQTRMWLASQWSVRAGRDWREGAQEMYRHLLDGSPAANRLGWQWAVGTATGKPYGFSRWQVEKRAPGLCATCALRQRCPVQDWPEADAGPRADGPADLAGGSTDAGPAAGQVATDLGSGAAPEAVWLTAESLGDGDPAWEAHPDLPAVFVFDEPLLARLGLSGKRLVFLAECLADLAARRPLEVRRGDVAAELAGRPLAATWAPVPGWRRRAARLDVVAAHPWPWLRRPGSGSLRSFSAWASSTGGTPGAGSGGPGGGARRGGPSRRPARPRR